MILLQQAPEYLVMSAYITSASYPIMSFKLSFLRLACLTPTLHSIHHNVAFILGTPLKTLDEIPS